jgi:ATP/maltotriose-dependent transcriptional regulator MalT
MVVTIPTVACRADQVSLSPELAAAVTERTEGWPVGLYLAALIAKDSEAEAWAIAGDDRYVADYLYQETLIRQPEDTQRFLRRTAVLDHFCAPLCDAVLGSSGTAGSLRHLEASGLFLIPLHRRRQWYRYHALFREFLLGELRRTEPDRITMLHQRAADWYESSGSPAQAVEHLLQTTDQDRTVCLATRLALPAYMAGRLPAVLRWYRAIGDVNIERYPRPRCKRMQDYAFSSLAFAGAARLSVHCGDLDEARRQLARAMRARPTATYLVPCLAVRLRLQLAKVYLAMADPGTARQLLREIGDILVHRPSLGALIEEAGEFRCALASSAASGANGRPPLTPAELRLLPCLQTHLTARGIAERLVLSRQTVQSEVKSIYRKLGVSSREETVQQATAIGLLGA